MKWALVDGLRSLAAPGLVGACPGCGGEVVAKCGELVQWHWAHRDRECDPWSEPESAWHIDWKNRFPTEWQERVMSNHRADVLAPKGVIEFQKSSISAAEIREREQFYGRMVWVIEASEFVLERHTGLHRKSYVRIEPRPAGDLFALLAGLDHGFFERLRAHVDKAWEAEPHYRWLWPHKSWLAARKTLLLDRGFDELLQVKWMSGTGGLIICKRLSKQTFVELVSR